MSKALNSFSKLDNSLRANILLNCEQLKDKFEEEDMKTIDYSNLITKTKTDIISKEYYINNCNLFIFVTKSSDLLSSIHPFISVFKPIHITTITTTDESELYLNTNYSFIKKISSLYVYKRNLD
jgi:hypothetical protein